MNPEVPKQRPRLPIASGHLRRIYDQEHWKAGVLSSVLPEPPEVRRARRVMGQAYEADIQLLRLGYEVTSAWLSEDEHDLRYSFNVPTRQNVLDKLKEVSGGQLLSDADKVGAVLLANSFSLSSVQEAGCIAKDSGPEAKICLVDWLVLHDCSTHALAAMRYLEEDAYRDLLAPIAASGTSRECVEALKLGLSEPSEHLLSKKLIKKGEDIYLYNAFRAARHETTKDFLFEGMCERGEAFAVNLLIDKASSRFIPKIIDALIEMGNTEFVARVLRRPLPNVWREKLVRALEDAAPRIHIEIALRFPLPSEFEQRLKKLARAA